MSLVPTNSMNDTIDESDLLHQLQDQTEASVDFVVQDRNIRVRDDVKILVKNYDDQHMCHFWFNTAFIRENNMIVLEKSVIDKANKDKKKKFDSNFKIELYFDLINEDDEDYDQYLYTLHESNPDNNNNNNEGTDDKYYDEDGDEVGED